MSINKVFTKGKCAVVLSTAIAVSTILSPALVSAEGRTVVSLGADLSASDKQTVLNILGVSSDISEDDILTITNAEEHQYLDSYLDSSVIGTRSLSCAAVTSEEEGYGIQVATQNITYCTASMYENALATAGMKNAKVIVAGPYNVSGTAALVGVMKAYSELTGEPLQAEMLDAASDELVTTGQIAESVGDSDKVSSLITAIKAEVIEKDIQDEDDIRELVKNTASQMGLELSESDIDAIVQLMKKLASMDLDASQISSQLSDAYNELKQQGIDLGISDEQATSLIDKITGWFMSIFETIKGWFS